MIEFERGTKVAKGKRRVQTKKRPRALVEEESSGREEKLETVGRGLVWGRDATAGEPTIVLTHG